MTDGPSLLKPEKTEAKIVTVFDNFNEFYVFFTCKQ